MVPSREAAQFYLPRRATLRSPSLVRLIIVIFSSNILYKVTLIFRQYWMMNTDSTITTSVAGTVGTIQLTVPVATTQDNEILLGLSGTTTGTLGSGSKLQNLLVCYSCSFFFSIFVLQ